MTTTPYTSNSVFEDAGDGMLVYRRPRPNAQNESNENLPSIQSASPAEAAIPSLSSAKPPVTNSAFEDAGDGVLVYRRRKASTPAPQEPGKGIVGETLEEAKGAALAFGTGVTSGVEVLGSLLEATIMPETGKSLRESGVSGTKYLQENMPPEWQSAVNRSFLDLSSEGALRSPRSWAAGIMQMLPYMIGTGGLGEVGAVGLRLAGVGAKSAAQKGLTGEAAKLAAQNAARKTSYGTVGAAAGAGEAASGTARDADARGLSDDERRAAMRVAAVPGAIAGRYAGKYLDEVFAAKTGLKALGAGAVAEGIEEAGTQFGTEVGKTYSGGEFSFTDIAEAFVGGAVLGGPAGAVVNKGAKLVGAGRKTGPIDGVAEETAIAEKELARIDAVKAAGSPTAPENTNITPGADATNPSPLLTTEVLQQNLIYDNGRLLDAQQKLKETSKPAEKNKIRKEIKSIEASIAHWSGQLKTKTAPAGPVTNTATDAPETAQAVTAVAAPNSTLPPGIPTNDVPEAKPEPIKEAELASIEAKLDEIEQSQPEEPPAVTAKVRKSQSRKAGAATKAASKQVPGAEEAVDPNVSAPPKSPSISAGNAEAQAISQTIKPKETTLPETTEAASPASVTQPTDQASGGSETLSAGTAASQPAPSEGPGIAGQTPVIPTVPGPTGPVDTRVPKTRKQKGFTPAPTTLNLQETAQQAQAKLGDESNENLLTGEADAGAEAAPNSLPSTKPKPIKGRPRMTPSERLKKVLADGPKDLDTVLAALQDAHTYSKDGPAYRLIERLRKAFPRTKNKPSPVIVENFKMDNGFQGLYDPKKDRIFVDLEQAEDAVTAVLHEAVHAAIVARVRLDPKERERWAAYIRQAQDAWYRNQWRPSIEEIPAFNSVEEFIATALTDTAMADKFSALKIDDGIAAPSIMQKIRFRLKDIIGVRTDPKAATYFDVLLNFIPDGTWLQDGNRQEWLAEMERLGLSHPSALFNSVMRSALRSNTIASALPNSGFNRPRAGLLQLYSVEQIARSFGYLTENIVDNTGNTVDLSNGINNYYDYITRRDAYANVLKVQASRAMEVYKNAVATSGSAHLDNLLVDARYWSIHPDLPANDPKNAFGVSLPGGAAKHADLWLRWNSPLMSNQMRDAFNLVRDSSKAELSETINQITIQRMRAKLGDKAADELEAYIYQNIPGRYNERVTAGVKVKWQSILSANEISNFMASYGAANNISILKQRETSASLVEVISELGVEQGPYVPLRRDGNYYTVLETAPQTQVMTAAALNTFAADNRDKDLYIIKADEIVRNGKKTGTWRVKYQHKYVSAHDTEAQSQLELEEKTKEWAGWNLTPTSSKWGLARDQRYSILGLEAGTIRALRDEIEKSLPGPAGKAASDKIITYYLEKLPDTSVRKSALKAKKIAGADRDMLHVLSSHAMGAGYVASQLKYGHKIARILNTELKNDIEKIQKAGNLKKAADVQLIANHLSTNDRNADRLASEDYFGRGVLGRIWNGLPQIAGAWVLTGLGTSITNSLQPMVMTYPHLSAIHGNIQASVAMFKAMKDVVGWSAVETTKEAARFGWNTLKSGASLVSKRKLLLRSFRNPSTPFFDYITRNLPQDERELIDYLANYKKIDFGLTADLQSLARKQNKLEELAGYVADGAFILPQAIETTNRVVTALASYRLNKAKVAADPAYNTPEKRDAELRRRAAQDIDRTQWNYSAVNKPAVFQSNLLRPFSTFKTYPQSMFYTIMRNMLEGFRGKTPQDRAIARKTLAGITLATFAVSGAIGIFAFEPFYIAAVALAAMFADEGEDYESALRGWMQEYVSQDLADFLLKGVPYGAGVADTGRMGIPQLMPWQDLFRTVTASDGAPDLSGVVGQVILGAPGSILEQTWNGVYMMLQGDVSAGLSQALPKAFGLNDAARAYNYAVNGAADRVGDPFIDPNDISLGDKFVRFLGFEPPEIARAKQNNRSFMSRDRAATDGKNALVAKYARAYENADRSSLNNIVLDIRDWNKRNPRYSIHGKTLREALKRRNKREQTVARYGVNARTKAQKMLAREIEMENPVDT